MDNDTNGEGKKEMGIGKGMGYWWNPYKKKKTLKK